MSETKLPCSDVRLLFYSLEYVVIGGSARPLAHGTYKNIPIPKDQEAGIRVLRKKSQRSSEHGTDESTHTLPRGVGSKEIEQLLKPSRQRITYPEVPLLMAPKTRKTEQYNNEQLAAEAACRVAQMLMSY